MDFELECNRSEYGDDWDFECGFVASSEKARSEFGLDELGRIELDHERAVLEYLHSKYPEIIPEETVILSLVIRYKERDKENKLKGVGMAMTCSILKYLYVNKNVTTIYLEAIEPRLIDLYRKFGFVSLDPDNPQYMIGDVENIAGKCIRNKKRKIPLKRLN